MAILGQILARLGHFWALPKIFRNVSDHHRFQHKKYCGFGKFELLRRQSRRFSNHSTMVPHYIAILSNSTYNLTCLHCTGIGSLELDVFTFDQLDEFMRDSRQ